MFGRARLPLAILVLLGSVEFVLGLVGLVSNTTLLLRSWDRGDEENEFMSIVGCLLGDVCCMISFTAIVLLP